jgi:tRNA pseudouridine13 synthase
MNDLPATPTQASLPTFPYAADLPGLSGCIRCTPEDFQVWEELGFTASGSGEHALLRVRKRDANTEWVARQLAAFAGVPAGAVSYAGRKDRHAVTEQWFSVHLPGRPDPDWPACGDDSFSVLEHHRHHRKLRRGALSGNAFLIVIRELRGDPAELSSRLQRIAQSGVPNYFGEQRFGHDGANLAQAEALLAGRARVRDRNQRSLYLSAARGWVFNQVLARRLTDGTWDQVLPGDVLMLDGRHSVFVVGTGDAVEAVEAVEAVAAVEAVEAVEAVDTANVLDDSLRQRVAALELHPTGPLWGRGELLSRGTVRTLEQAVAADWSTLCQGLEQAGLEAARRALRLRIQDLAWQQTDPTTLTVRFRLTAGAYATAVLRELVHCPE